jgi:hypothetical protein
MGIEIDTNLLCYFLIKLYSYESSLFYQIKNMVGLPRMKI